MAQAQSLAELQVSEHDGVARRAFPVTGGIPLARGLARAADALVLLDADGRPLDMQAEVLSRWGDGSARWILLDFQVDLQPTETRVFQLVAGCPSEEVSVSGDRAVDGEPLPRGSEGSSV